LTAIPAKQIQKANNLDGEETMGLKLAKLTEFIGAEVLGVDQDIVLRDEAFPSACNQALEENGVLVFRNLFLDDAMHTAFCGRLGRIQRLLIVVSRDKSKSTTADYLNGTFLWHMDGTAAESDDVPNKATVLSAHAVAERGGETEFVSTYAAYDRLKDAEKEQLSTLRAFHSLLAKHRRLNPHLSLEAEAVWSRMAEREHPIVWRRRNGRNSLVIGATASHIVGKDYDEGRALLEDLQARATAPNFVYRHQWALGDTIIWDNTGTLHRALPYDPASPRELHRTTILGDETIA
jgi:alpha-ketoglutarate-dependent sulfate ester dioxygenase